MNGTITGSIVDSCLLKEEVKVWTKLGRVVANDPLYLLRPFEGFDTVEALLCVISGWMPCKRSFLLYSSRRSLGGKNYLWEVRAINS